MADFEHGREPVGERVARIEGALPEVLRRLDEIAGQLGDQRKDMKDVVAALNRRSGSLSAVGWLGDGVRVVVAALLSGVGLHFFQSTR